MTQPSLRAHLSTSVTLDPRLGLVEGAEVDADLELAVLDPDLRPVDLAVFRVQDAAALVAIPVAAKVLDDHEADDRLVLFVALAGGTGLRLPRLVIALGQTRDRADELAALLRE